MNANVNETDLQVFMSALEGNRNAYAKVSQSIKYLRLHEDLMTYSGPDGDFNLLAADYKEDHTYVDILKEALKIGKNICNLNAHAKNDPNIGKTFLPRRYVVQENLVNYENTESVGLLFNDSFDLVQYFSDLYTAATAKRKNAASQTG